MNKLQIVIIWNWYHNLEIKSVLVKYALFASEVMATSQQFDLNASCEYTWN